MKRRVSQLVPTAAVGSLSLILLVDFGRSWALTPPTSMIPSPQQDPLSFRDVVRRVMPAVVSIEAKGRRIDSRQAASESVPDDFQPYFDQPLRRRSPPGELVSLGFGSGVVIDSQGIILTSSHVVEGADELEIRTHDGRRYRALEVRFDRLSDLAVVRIQPRARLTSLEFADSDQMELGDRVLALGAPFGLRGSVSHGIVSAKGRTLKPYTYEDYLQTDAAVNPGNSGGPLVNCQGRLIGILTAIKSRTGGFQGVGLAVSSNWARRVADELRAKGRVSRGYLGLLVEDLDPDEREKLGVKGAVVTGVIVGSPAEQASLQRSDVVLQVQDQPVSGASDLQKTITFTPPGSRITLDIRREGQHSKIQLNVAELPKTIRLPSDRP